MRKITLAMFVVILLGGCYIAAQAYSSHVFERELAGNIVLLDDDGEWQVTRHEIDPGWFHSTGRIRLEHAHEAGWHVSVPYAASHGLLRTRISGSLQAYFVDEKNGEQAVFGALLPSAEPRWTATLHTLDQRGEGRLDIAAFDIEEDDFHFSFTGAEITFEGHAGDIQLAGRFAPLRLRHGDNEITTGSIHLNGRYQFDEQGRLFYQRDELVLDRLEYKGAQHAPMTLTGLSYSDEARLDEQLRIEAVLSLEQARMAGEPLLSGRIDMLLERINGPAARRLFEQLEPLLEQPGEALLSLDETQREELRERYAPLLRGVLVDSPRFSLESATLVSPMLGIDVRGHGELIFNGEEIESLSFDEGSTDWLQRLNGRFSWHGIPPLVALQLGLPMDTQKLEITIGDGQLRLNDRPLPALF